ncbi:MAG: hypothetical protein S4CHLAM20_11390 [Chlamydiia bacterium]|nr:hypothetical protein [Chlamydiia bacterium]
MVTKELRIAWGARTIDVDSHRVFERDTLQARAIKILISIVIAPLTLIVIICFLIKMAVSACLQHRATIEAALNNAQERIEELREQFFSLHNQGRNQEALSLVERNERFLRGQSDILAIVAPLEEDHLSEARAASPKGPEALESDLEEEESVSSSSDSEEDEVMGRPDDRRSLSSKGSRLSWNIVYKAEIKALTETLSNTDSFGAKSLALFEDANTLDKFLKHMKQGWDQRLQETQLQGAGLNLQVSKLHETIEACEGEFGALSTALDERITRLKNNYSGTLNDLMIAHFEKKRDRVQEVLEFLMKKFTSLKTENKTAI